MTRWTRLALAGGAVVIAVVLFVVLRPDDDEDAEPTPAAQTTTGDTTGETTTEDTETETETEDTTTGEAPTTTQADNPDEPQRIVIVVRDGQPVGGVKRPEIDEGKQVVLVVRSDVADHMHLHGYDLLADVAPGQPGRIQFRADLPGRFDLELEDRAVLIAELRVS
ncbi:MAG: hypothetical protein ACRDNR_01710 [Gaiellaceae bacterium]